jgi:hypothetical protein
VCFRKHQKGEDKRPKGTVMPTPRAGGVEPDEGTASSGRHREGKGDKPSKEKKGDKKDKERGKDRDKGKRGHGGEGHEEDEGVPSTSHRRSLEPMPSPLMDDRGS